jgi:hypothetical protein
LIQHEVPAMRRFRPRFTIQSLMMVVVVVAGLLTLQKWLGLMVIALPFPCLAGVGALWLVFRGQQQFTAFGFWVTATLINVSYAALYVAPEAYLLPALFLGWMVFAGPAIGGLGAAWVALATRQDVTPRRSSSVRWLTVIALSGMPLVTLWTMWPLHLAFRASSLPSSANCK